jgi:hypothetical protein
MRRFQKKVRVVAVAAVVTLGSSFLLAGAAPGASKAPAGGGGVTPATAGCTVTFTNPGPPALTACVSGHGNVNDIVYSAFGSPVDHVNSEGYCLYNNDDGVAYYDNGIYAEENWGAATLSSTSKTATITRTTTDGKFTLTQNIFFKYGSRLVLVGNLVKNNDTVTHSVYFMRSFDGDIEGGALSDVYDSAGSTVLGKDTDALALTTLGNPSLVTGIGAETYANWRTGSTQCFDVPETVPTAPGDHAGFANHFTHIAPGATVNFRVGYRLL